MEGLKTVLTIIYLLVCIGIVVLVMLQDSKGQGLAAALSGSAGSNSYWSKNKGRSKEGKMNKLTILLAAVFIILSVVLSLDAFNK